jgi:hypothetical protein
MCGTVTNKKKVRSLVFDKVMGEVKKFALERQITIPH